MAQALDNFKRFLYLVFLLIFVTVIMLEFRPIVGAIHKLLNRVESLSSVEIAAVKFSFTSENVTAAINELNMDNIPPPDQGRALDLIYGMEQDEFVRLMYVGQLHDLCEYDAPADTRMRSNVATDYKLADKKLVQMIENPDLLSRQIAQNGRSVNGRPIRCYEMTLTPEGANVKTALISSFGRMLKKVPAKTAPAVQQVASQ